MCMLYTCHKTTINFSLKEGTEKCLEKIYRDTMGDTLGVI